jgi:hypothetical protein
MRKPIKIFAVISILTIFITFVLFSFLIWQGGYWENLSPFDRISGPKRFRQFVVDPIPPYINELRGGYSGFPQGQITTLFNFTGTLKDWNFLSNWAESSSPEKERVTELFSEELNFSRVYKHLNKDYYLALDEKSGKGLLYIP